MYTVFPHRRATASAVQLSVGHILGDAFSPLIIGYLSEMIQQGKSGPSSLVQYSAFENILLFCPLLAAVGGSCFLVTANYIVYDKARVDQHIKELKTKEQLLLSTIPST